MAITNEQKKVIIDYFRARKAGNINTCMDLVSDHIKFISQIDGTFIGKYALEKFIKTHKPSANWDTSNFTTINDTICVYGTTKWLLSTIKLKAEFKIGNDNKISYLKIGSTHQ